MHKDHKDNKLNAFTLLVAVVVVTLMAVTAAAEGRQVFPPKENEQIKAGVGLQGICPSYFAIVKVSDFPYSDMGSGSFIARNTVLTCAHNVRDFHVGGKGKLTVQSHDGTVYRNVSVLVYEPELDIAVLRIEDFDGSGTHSTIRLGTEPVSGESVYSIGWVPRTSQVELYVGLMTDEFSGRSGSSFGYKTWVNHTSQVVQGMSGGPLLNSKGRLVGVNISNNPITLDGCSVRTQFISKYFD